jgi:hypothetical protein
MKKILFGLTAMAVLAAPFASEAWAGPRAGSAHTSSYASASAYRTTSRASVSTYRATSYTSVPAYRSTARTSVSTYRATSYTSVPAYRATSYTIANRPTYSANHTYSGRYANYHQTYGTRFAYGYFYRGRNHSHWSYQRWDARYGCYCYYDPCCTSWYYWCEPASCYYPVSYCPYQTYCWNTPVVEPAYTQPAAVQVPSSPSPNVPPTTYPPQQPVSTPPASNWEAPRTYTPPASPEPMTPAVDE